LFFHARGSSLRAHRRGGSVCSEGKGGPRYAKKRGKGSSLFNSSGKGEEKYGIYSGHAGGRGATTTGLKKKEENVCPQFALGKKKGSRKRLSILTKKEGKRKKDRCSYGKIKDQQRRPVDKRENFTERGGRTVAIEQCLSKKGKGGASHRPPGGKKRQTRERKKKLCKGAYPKRTGTCLSPFPWREVLRGFNGKRRKNSLEFALKGKGNFGLTGKMHWWIIRTLRGRGSVTVGEKGSKGELQRRGEEKAQKCHLKSYPRNLHCLNLNRKGEKKR